MAPATPKRGRRPGPSTTRAEILDAARALFGRHGYEGTTLRMIAESARVDPALVARAFGDKDGLFLAAVAWPWDPSDVVPEVAHGPRGRAGARISRLVLDTWEDPQQRAPIVALLTSTGTSDVARNLLRDFVTLRVQVPFVRACGFDEPEVRGALLSAQHIGLCMARYVIGIEPLASMDADMLVDIAGASAQHVLTRKLPAIGASGGAPGRRARGPAAGRTARRTSGGA
jgi:AcrR family transcriptional regulator